MKMQRLDAPSRLRHAWHCGAGAGRGYRPRRLPVLTITNFRIRIIIRNMRELRSRLRSSPEHVR